MNDIAVAHCICIFFLSLTACHQNDLTAVGSKIGKIGKDGCQAAIVKTRKAFVEDKRDLLVFEKRLDKSQTKAEVSQILGAAAEVIGGTGGVSVAVT